MIVIVNTSFDNWIDIMLFISYKSFFNIGINDSKLDIYMIDTNVLTEKFNPDFHQAVSTIKAASKENDIVSEVVQQGYSLNGRVIKPPNPLTKLK